MPSIYVNPKHHEFLKILVGRHLRSSMAAIVAEAISAYIPRLQRELDFWEDLQLKKDQPLIDYGDKEVNDLE